MSEYNVFVSEQGVTVFDWPQAVPTDHANARELLVRDVENVVGYVRRKHPAEVPESLDTGAIADDLSSGSFDTVRDYAVS
jgi:RIO kinase 2